MKKTKESIKLKWDKYYESIYAKEMRNRKQKVEQLKERNQLDLEKKINGIDKKTIAKLKKKRADCDRHMLNEIRKLEGKPQRVYKEKKKTFNIVKFIAELMQENAKLRDTDLDGNWYCISHVMVTLFPRSMLQWWHRWSREIKNICLCFWNINAQCKDCNRTTWPRGNKVEEEKTNAIYDAKLDIKYWNWTAEKLRLLKDSYFKNDYDWRWMIGDKLLYPTKEALYKFAEDQLLENRLRWNGKTFYKPSQNWQKIWDKNKSDFIVNEK